MLASDCTELSEYCGSPFHKSVALPLLGLGWKRRFRQSSTFWILRLLHPSASSPIRLPEWDAVECSFGQSEQHDRSTFASHGESRGLLSASHAVQPKQAWQYGPGAYHYLKSQPHKPILRNK